jgi:hypothetical protein
MNEAGMVESVKKSDKKINLFWGNRIPDEDFVKLNAYQRVNHFPGTYFLGRKDHLLRGLARMRRKHGEGYDFFPTTFFLPRDASMLRSEMVRQPGKIYIAKPPASSCGKGIFVFATENEIPEGEFIIQHYISDPLLINNHKFDMRVYVAVTCYDPLRVYVFQEGLVRFATEPYSLEPTSLANRFMHLTNYSINHHSEKFQKNKDDATNTSETEGAHKWSLTALRSYMAAHEMDYDTMWSSVHDLIIKTLLTCEGVVCSKVSSCSGHRETCFELYGFDVLLRTNLEPVIMEVNVWPSLNCGSPLDRRIKGVLVVHLLNMIGVQPCDWSDNTGGLSVNNNNPKVVAMTRRDDTETDIGQWLLSLQESDKTFLRAHEDENYRCGSFQRIFPCGDGEIRYCPLFDAPRYNSILGCRWEKLKHIVGTAASSLLIQWLQGPVEGRVPDEVLRMVCDKCPVPRPMVIRTTSELRNMRRSSLREQPPMETKKPTRTQSLRRFSVGRTVN